MVGKKYKNIIYNEKTYRKMKQKSTSRYLMEWRSTTSEYYIIASLYITLESKTLGLVLELESDKIAAWQPPV